MQRRNTSLVWCCDAKSRGSPELMLYLYCNLPVITAFIENRIYIFCLKTQLCLTGGKRVDRTTFGRGAIPARYNAQTSENRSINFNVASN